LTDTLKRIIGKKDKKNRDNLEIVRDVLAIASVKSKKTRIMYQANLSYRILEKYLNSLLDNHLMECDDDAYYSITSRGKEFLQQYNDYLDRCKKIGEEVVGARKERLLLENICFNNQLNSK
jgi:predicted transcriptional regulator